MRHFESSLEEISTGAAREQAVLGEMRLSFILERVLLLLCALKIYFIPISLVTITYTLILLMLCRFNGYFLFRTVELSPELIYRINGFNYLARV